MIANRVHDESSVIGDRSCPNVGRNFRTFLVLLLSLKHFLKPSLMPPPKPSLIIFLKYFLKSSLMASLMSPLKHSLMACLMYFSSTSSYPRSRGGSEGSLIARTPQSYLRGSS